MLNGVSGDESGMEEYYLDILEKQSMQPEIVASALFKLEEQGAITLYIKLEAGKSNLPPPAESIVSQVTELLRAIQLRTSALRDIPIIPAHLLQTRNSLRTGSIAGQ